MESNKNKAVIFVDILGFSSLTESHSINLDLIRAADRYFPDGIKSLKEFQENQLLRQFMSFHRSLKWVIDEANTRHSTTSITFSDSAFISTEELGQAVNIAIALMHTLLPQKVPVRIGVACGTFETLRFRTDITSEGGEHAAHFLGTGIVRAHAAESCGIKGFRILMHPSVEPLIQSKQYSSLENRLRYIECPEDERANVVNVRYEVDYWGFKPAAEKEAWQALQDMWDFAPGNEVKHYLATAKAINRMRVSRGEERLDNLRRRTLSRK